MEQNDLGTNIIFTITDSCGTAVNLITATTVKVRMQLNNNFQIERNASFYDRANGKVSFTIQTGDLASTGMAKFQLQVYFNDGTNFNTSRVYEIVEPSYSF